MKVDWGFWEVLVGITSLSLAVLAILIGGASIYLYFRGRPWIEELVRNEVRKEIESTEKELRGRLVGYVGFVFGRLRKVNPELIHPAIQYSQYAYETLPDTSAWKMRAMNNLAFYYSVRGYVTDAPAAIRYARALLEDYAKSGDIDWLTTYAVVVGRYYEYFDSPRQRLLEAERMMEELQQRGDVSQGDKQNAAGHLETLRAALRLLG